MVTKTRLKTTQIAILPSEFVSVQQLMGTTPDRWYIMKTDEFYEDQEQTTIGQIYALFGINYFPDPGILLADLSRGKVYPPLLKNIQGKPQIQFGNNAIPLVDGKLGEADVSIQAVTQTVKDDNGKDITLTKVQLVCEKPTDEYKLRMVLEAALVEGADANEVADLLKDGDFDTILPMLQTPSGGGGLMVAANYFMKLFKLSDVQLLPQMILPIKNAAFSAVEWEGKKIRSLSLTIDSEFLPEQMLIRWKIDGVKKDCRATKDQIKGFQFAVSSNAYNAFCEDKDADDHRVKPAMLSKMAQGQCFLAILSYNGQDGKDKVCAPNHAIWTRAAKPSDPAVIYADLDYSTLQEFPALPSRDDTSLPTPKADTPGNVSEPVAAADSAGTPVIPF